jgi:hypothetical protein
MKKMITTLARIALYDAHAESGSEIGSEADEALRDEHRVSPFLPNRTWQTEEERECWAVLRLHCAYRSAVGCLNVFVNLS